MEMEAPSDRLLIHAISECEFNAAVSFCLGPALFTPSGVNKS